MDDWWQFHDVGNNQCSACAVTELPVCACGKGLVHTQFSAELDAIEARCDQGAALDTETRCEVQCN